jgi:hypothetical protein
MYLFVGQLSSKRLSKARERSNWSKVADRRRSVQTNGAEVYIGLKMLLLSVVNYCVKGKETHLSYNVMMRVMCDFIGYEIKDRLRMKIIEEEALEEVELEKVEEQPITITQ